MKGLKHPSDRIMKVERSFEWSRLENQLMTSAYECVLPLVRSAQTRPLLAGHDPGCNEFDRSDCTRQRYATGA
jgi:hypothetical protein